MRHAVAGGRSVAVGKGVERVGDVASLRVGRRLLEGSELVLARVLLLVFAREREAALATVTAIVCSLMSVEVTC